MVIKASPPSRMLLSSSMSVLQLVTKMMGTVEKARIWEHRENPLWPGSLISRRIKWG